MAISQYRAGSQEDYRRNRDCLPEIAPQGGTSSRFALRAPQPLEPRNDKSEGIAPMNLCRDHCQSAWRSQPTKGSAPHKNPFTFFPFSTQNKFLFIFFVELVKTPFAFFFPPPFLKFQI